MNSRKISLRAIAALCDEVGPEDGVDPRQVRRTPHRRKKDKKAKQVSRQAEMTVQLTLGALLDEALEDLRVVRVEHAPDSRRLLVVLGPRGSSTSTTEADAAEVVQKVEQHLRREVAAAIHRKRAPSLTFAFVGMREDERHDD